MADDEIESIVFPEATYLLNSPEDRAERATMLIARGHAANRGGDFEAAAALFGEASGLEPQRASTLISYLNMRLKMGDHELAVACYLRCLEDRQLSAKEMEHVRAKLREANRRMVETNEEREAATLITRVARGIATRRGLSTQLRRVHSICVVQSVYF